MDENMPRIIPIADLPEYQWMCWDDGSGCIQNLQTKEYLYSYDLAPYANQQGIEFKFDKNSKWNVFWGTFQEFKNFIEQEIKEKIQNIDEVELE